jgi:two-component system phosphate regulon response regulator PhoB
MSSDNHYEALACGDVFIDIAAHRVTQCGQPVHLGPIAFELLRLMMASPGRIFTRRQLHQAAWNTRVHVEERTVDVHIRQIRRSLKADAQSGPIQTFRGVGYAVRSDGRV